MHSTPPVDPAEGKIAEVGLEQTRRIRQYPAVVLCEPAKYQSDPRIKECRKSKLVGTEVVPNRRTQFAERKNRLAKRKCSDPDEHTDKLWLRKYAFTREGVTK